MEKKDEDEVEIVSIRAMSRESPRNAMNKAVKPLAFSLKLVNAKDEECRTNSRVENVT
jgi:hypothetical protein